MAETDLLKVPNFFKYTVDPATGKLIRYWYDSTVPEWKVVDQMDLTEQAYETDLHVKKSTPGIRLHGEESGGEDWTIRENAGFLELYDNIAGVLEDEWLFNQSFRIEKDLPYIRLKDTQSGGQDWSIRSNVGKVELYDHAALALASEWALDQPIFIEKASPYLRLKGTESGGVDSRIIEDAGDLKIQYWDGTSWVNKLVLDLATGNLESIGKVTQGTFSIEGSTPYLELIGTETGAITTRLRENAGVVEFVGTSGARQAVLPYDNLIANTIQFIIDVPILGGAAQNVAADAVGTSEFAHTTTKVTSEAVKHLKSAQLVVDYDWAATANGYIELYDRTTGTVLAQSAAKSGGESAEWEGISVTGIITAGNEMCVRVDITTAGAAGETVTLYRAILRLICGVS